MPPVDYATDNYPDRAEDANPDKYLRQPMTKADQPVPGPTGNITSAPAREDGNILAPGFDIRVALVISHLEGNSIAASALIGMGWSLTGAGVPITEVPLITVGGKTAGNLWAKPDFLLFLQPRLVSSEFDVKLGLLQTYFNK